MNSQSIANLQGKLINVEMLNGALKKGVLEAVHDEYFILKNEVEAKVREFVYYDGVKSASEVSVINWQNFVNQKVGFETNDGTFHTGFFLSVAVGIYLEIIEKGNTKFYMKGQIKSINTVSFIEGDKLTLQNNVPATVEKVEKDKVWVSLTPSDLFTLTINKEEVKSEERNNLQGCMIGEKKCEPKNLINSNLKDASLTLTKEKLKFMCYYDEFNKLNNIYNYALVNANSLKILSPNKLDTLIEPGTEVVINLTHSITFKCLFNETYKRGNNKYYSLMFRKDESTLEVLNTTSDKHDAIFLTIDNIEKKEEEIKHRNPEIIKRFIEKALALPDFSKHIPAYMYQGFLEIQRDEICKDKVFPVFQECYNKIREYISSKFIKGHSLQFLKLENRIDFVYGWSKAYHEYCIEGDLKEQIECASDLLKKLDNMLGRVPPHKYFSPQKEKIQSLKNTVKNSLEQAKDTQTKLQNLKDTVKVPLEQEEKEKLFFSSIGKDIQTKLQNLKDTVKVPLEQGKEMKILYRGKPKTITIINKYTKNNKEYAVITDHTDNDKTKTLFTSYIEIVN